MRTTSYNILGNIPGDHDGWRLIASAQQILQQVQAAHARQIRVDQQAPNMTRPVS
jgi:hypothetical protein